VGTPVAGRKRTETEGLIGFFINTLVLRTRMRGEWSFRELLEEVRERTLEAYEHQDVPFEKLVDELEVERDMSRSPLFQVAMVLQNAGQEELRLPGLEVEEFSLAEDNRTAKFDLTWGLWESGSGLAGGVEYNTDLYERETVARMVERWQGVLEQGVENAERRLREISLWGAGERERWVVGRENGDGESGEEIEKQESFAMLVARRAAAEPERMAVVGEGCRLTFAELNRQGEQWGHYLKKQGVKAGTRVGVCLERVEAWAVAILGVMKAGGVVVGLAGEESRERMGRMVESSETRLVITEKRQAGMFGGDGVRLLLLEEDQEKIAKESEEAVGEMEAGRGVEEEGVGCVLYRGCGEGRPAGVLLPQRVLVGNGEQGGNSRSQDRVGQAVGFGKELGCLETLRTLARGGCVVHVPGGEAESPRGVANLLREEKVTEWWAAAGMVERVAREFPWALKSVREIVCEDGQEGWPWLQQALEKEVVERTYTVLGWDEGGGGWLKVGLAEVNVEGSREVRPEQLRAGMKMYVLDEEMDATPEEVVGEIYVGGKWLGLGYEGEGGWTAGAFVPDPYGEAGGRLYRTGERGRRRGNGRVEYCGREDGRMRIGGRRVEAEEIEAILREQGGIKEAVVVAREGEGEHEVSLVAVIVRGGEGKDKGEGEGARVEEEELLRQVRERMGERIELKKVIEVEAIARGVGGRIDRKAVARMVARGAGENGGAEYAGAETDVEKILVKIWEEVLKRGRIGIHDNFFKLGGDSILSIQVISRARQAGVELTPRQLFEKQTIAELAGVAGRGVAIVAEQGRVQGRVPMTPFQRVFFEWELAKAEHFNQAVVVELKAAAQTELLERAVAGLLEHHDALRMRYERRGESWEQWCQTEVKAEGLYQRKNFIGLSESEQRAAMERETERAQSSLDLGAGRLVQAVEYELGERGRRLLLVIHHLVVDGVSWRILLEDLERGYEQLQAGQPIDLGRKTTSFRQWGERLQEYGSGEELPQEVEYWSSAERKQVKPLGLDYQSEGGRAENLVATQRSVVEELETEETRALLQEVPAVYNTQINDVLLTALGRVLEEWRGRGSEGVLVDVEGHGREEMFADMDLSRTVGWFTSVYPALLGVSTRGPWEPGKALSTVKEQLRMVPHRGLGYGVLRSLSGDEATRQQLREMGKAEIIFNYLGQVDQVLRGSALFAPSGESSGNAVAGQNRRAYVLEVSGIVAQGKLQMNWVYSEKLHRHETIAKLARRYMQCLRELIAHCRSEDAGGYTPSDFVADEMTHDELMQIASLLEQ
jgi:non-ribosomal peptide synthase protein (TIGR01720 family)